MGQAGSLNGPLVLGAQAAATALASFVVQGAGRWPVYTSTHATAPPPPATLHVALPLRRPCRLPSTAHVPLRAGGLVERAPSAARPARHGLAGGLSMAAAATRHARAVANCRSAAPRAWSQDGGHVSSKVSNKCTSRSTWTARAGQGVLQPLP